MVENVVIFGLKTCTHCKSLKKRLDELSIVYIDVDVHANDENKQLWSQIVEQTKNELVPTVFLKIKAAVIIL